MIGQRIKFYFKVFSLKLLIKDISFYLGFTFLVLLAGFTMPSMDLYKLISRAIVSNSLYPYQVYIVLAVIIFINLLLIKTSLADKYALRNQANIASILIFFSFAFLSFLGFWLRVYMEYVIPKEDVILGIVQSPTKPSLPPLYLPTAVTVSFTVSIFGVVFTLASGSYSKVDYSPFKSWMDKVIKTIDAGKKVNIETLKQDINNAIEAITKTLPYERKNYRQFVQRSLLTPLKTLEKFIITDAQQQPELLLELTRDNPRIRKLSEYNQAYKNINRLYKLG
jgi:hypothetical protein